MIRPTPENLQRFEKWSTSHNQNEVFFGDSVDHCYECRVLPGQTFFIPTGQLLYRTVLIKRRLLPIQLGLIGLLHCASLTALLNGSACTRVLLAVSVDTCCFAKRE